MSTEHRSSFALDVWFADGKRDDDVGAHVATCSRCAAYIANLEAVAGEDGFRPESGLRAGHRVPRSARWWAPAATALALAAGVLFFVRSRAEEDYVGVKGVPAVQVLVRSEGATRIWDGQSSIHAGDALAIHVACESLNHVAIVSEASAAFARISDSECPPTPAPLPFTLVVDDEPGHERFAVVLTKSRVDDEKLRALTHGRVRSRDAWVTAFDLPKEPRR